MLVVLPDSNSLFGRLIGTRPDRDWIAVLEDAKRGMFDLVIPEIVQWEIANQAQREAREQLARLRSAGNKLRRLQIEAPVFPRGGELAEERIAAATEEFRNQILLCGGRIAPIPSVSHAEVVRRSLDQRRPFDGSDRGYRDTLLWHTALDILREGNSVILVSNDKTAFAAEGPDEQLHPDLAAELRAWGLSGDLYLAKNLDRARRIAEELTGVGFTRIRQILEADDMLAHIMGGLAGDALGRTLEEEELLHWGWSADDLAGVRVLEIKDFGRIRPHAVAQSDGDSLRAAVRLEVLAELDVRAFECNDEFDAMAMPGPIHDIGVGLTDGLIQAYVDREVTLVGEVEISEKTGLVNTMQLTDIEIPRKLVREGQLELGHPFGDLVE